MDILSPEHAWVDALQPPRRWQAEALPLALDALREGRRGLVHAVMGAGKSVFIAEVARSLVLAEDERLIISTPTQALVEQLTATLSARLGGGVGRYYAEAHEVERPVIVVCNPSLEALAEELGGAGLRCAAWIVDEAHNSECPTGRTAARALGNPRVLGLTATPYRASAHETLSLFDELLYGYGPAEALEDGVVVPFEVRPWEGMEGISINDACVQMIRMALGEGLGAGLVDAGGWDHGQHRPMAGTDDADAFAARLVAEGIRAAAVHVRVAPGERRRRLQALEAGELDVVVHVTMLKEGVDLPFLRWLCLRRRVGSRVHFAQHVGRALRASPGKDRAVIFDPHDLFGAHALSVAAALNAGDDGPAPSPMQEVLALLEKVRPASQLALRLDPGDHGHAEALAGLERWLRRLTIALDTTGVIVREADSPSRGSWRRRRASPRQLAAIKANARRLRGVRGLPGEVRQVLRDLYLNAIRGALSRGACSDLLDVVFGLAQRGWSVEAERMLCEGSHDAVRHGGGGPMASNSSHCPPAQVARWTCQTHGPNSQTTPSEAQALPCAGMT